MLKVKIKKLTSEAKIPKYAIEGDAGMDFTAISVRVDRCYTEYGTGISMEIPKGYVGLLFPRSSISNKAQSLANCVGVIDSNYRGEIKFRFKAHIDLVNGAIAEGESDIEVMSLFYTAGEKVGQMIIMPYPEVQFEEVDELSMTNRGEGGFGSTTTVQGDITTT